MATYSYDSLRPQLRQTAASELNENPERLQAHIASLRRWLNQSPHLSCPSDDHFLLRFLRVAKFKQEKAEQRIENFCTIRGSPESGLPHKFSYPSLGDPDLEAYLQMGIHIVLESPDVSETFVLVRYSQWDVGKFNYERLLTFTFMMMEVLVADQKSQIGGVGAIIDMRNVGKEQIELMSNKHVIRECVRIWLTAFPMRNKHMVFCHESTLLDLSLKIFKMYLRPKLADRIFHVKNNMNKIQEKIQDVETVLPTELGGLNAPLEDCRQRWEERFRQHWSRSDAVVNVRVDESKRQERALPFLQPDGEKLQN